MSVPGLHGRIGARLPRAAASYDDVSRVYDEIGRRLLTHLDPIAIDPTLVLDVGCGTGTGAALLASRYRRSRVFAVDCARPMLEVAKTKAPKLFSRQRFVCGLAEHLPLRDACARISCTPTLLLPWCFTISRLRCASSPGCSRQGGLLLLSSLGPDTLIGDCEGSGRPEEESEPEPGLLDMHDLGDALVACGPRRRGNGNGASDGEVPAARQQPDRRPRAQRRLGSPKPGATAAGHGPRESFARLRGRYIDHARHRAPSTSAVEIVYAHAWAPPSAPRQTFRRRLRFPVRRDPSPGRLAKVVKYSLSD